MATEIGAKAYALVYEDGNFNLLIPGQEFLSDGDDVPPEAMVLTALFMRIDDPEFVKEQIDWILAEKGM